MLPPAGKTAEAAYCVDDIKTSLKTIEIKFKYV